MFLTAERRFQKLSASSRQSDRSQSECRVVGKFGAVYEREKVVWRLFVGPQPTMADNKLYAKFRKLLLEGSKLKADA